MEKAHERIITIQHLVCIGKSGERYSTSLRPRGSYEALSKSVKNHAGCCHLGQSSVVLGRATLLSSISILISLQHRYMRAGSGMKGVCFS